MWTRIITRIPACGLLAAGLLSTGLLATTLTPATAASRCKVTDPTGTPLNVRDAPQGKITGTVRNGTLVSIEAAATDAKGKPWAYVSDYSSGHAIGWVFREFISCF